MGLPITAVDAFSARPFAGNPAAVCLLDRPRDDDWLRRVADELHLSETAYLLPEGDAWRLRWFTPAVEVDLCGHATLASAHVLWERGLVPRGEVARFQTRSGLLTARQVDDGIELDLPADPPEPDGAPPTELRVVCGPHLRSVSRYRLGLLIELDTEEPLRAVGPEIARALTEPALTVTAPSADPAFDFVSRFFGPGFGIPEDPVTGAAHCGLGPFWAARLGKERVRGYQASARGGAVAVRVALPRVHLWGHAVTVWRGELVVD